VLIDRLIIVGIRAFKINLRFFGSEIGSGTGASASLFGRELKTQFFVPVKMVVLRIPWA
jgi:hypothetical protein